MYRFCALLGALLVVSMLGQGAVSADRYFKVTNRCSYPIWLNQEPNSNSDGLPYPRVIRYDPGQQFTYTIPANSWAGRFWAKINCDANGYNCEFGDATPPCPVGGCKPPADTKGEIYFGKFPGDANWYDISLVDGYSIPMTIIPIGGSGDGCVPTDCGVSLDHCPTSDNIAGTEFGDHRVWANGRVVACLSPCKRWNYPPPYGLGISEFEQPGVMVCCPTPPISPQQCNAGPVEQTAYVNNVRRDCPSAYSYAYDDQAGLHVCPYETSFDVYIC